MDLINSDVGSNNTTMGQKSLNEHTRNAEKLYGISITQDDLMDGIAESDEQFVENMTPVVDFDDLLARMMSAARQKHMENVKAGKQKMQYNEKLREEYRSDNCLYTDEDLNVGLTQKHMMCPYFIDMKVIGEKLTEQKTQSISFKQNIGKRLLEEKLAGPMLTGNKRKAMPKLTPVRCETGNYATNPPPPLLEFGSSSSSSGLVSRATALPRPIHPKPTPHRIMASIAPTANNQQFIQLPSGLSVLSGGVASYQANPFPSLETTSSISIVPPSRKAAPRKTAHAIREEHPTLPTPTITREKAPTPEWATKFRAIKPKIINLPFVSPDDDDDDNAVEEDTHEEGAPLIISTQGGVTIPSRNEDYDDDNDDYEESELSISDLRSMQESMTQASVTERAKNPLKKTVDGAEFLGCRTCGKTFPSNCDNMYRNHMLIKHNVEINDEMIKKSKLSAVAWHKCKKCHVMVLNNLEDHRKKCLPNAPIANAFERIEFAQKPDARLLCGICERSFPSRMSLRQHLSSNHREINSKVILDPMFRCTSCLRRLDDSSILIQHAQHCIRATPTRDTTIKLTKLLLFCEICNKRHKSVSETQACYNKKGLLRCLLCLHTVLSKTNFFNHMKNYHNTTEAGLICNFCPEKSKLIFPIRQCFEHMCSTHLADAQIELEAIETRTPVPPERKEVSINQSRIQQNIVVEQPQRAVVQPSVSYPANRCLTASALALAATRSNKPSSSSYSNTGLPIIKSVTSLSTPTTASITTIPPRQSPGQMVNNVIGKIDSSGKLVLNRPSNIAQNVVTHESNTTPVRPNSTVGGFRFVIQPKSSADGSTSKPPPPLIAAPSAVLK